MSRCCAIWCLGLCGVVLLSVSGPLDAADVHWVGTRVSPSCQPEFDHPHVSVLGNGLEWDAFNPPSPADVAVFGSGYTPPPIGTYNPPYPLQYGATIHLGDFTPIANCGLAFYPAQPAAVTSGARFVSGNWTLDFDPYRTSGGVTGNLAMDVFLVGGTLIDNTPGTAEVTVQGDGVLTTSIAQIGRGMNMGSVSLLGTAEWNVPTTMSIGHDGGIGEVFVEGGGLMNAETIIAGFVSGDGRLDVSGAGSAVATSGQLGIGVIGGSGLVTVTSGANMNVGTSIVIGENTGSTGLLTVSGAGSAVNSLMSMQMGFGGSGTVNIQAGGVLRTPGAAIGAYGGQGDVQISGLESQWDVGGEFNVADTEILIQSGGQLTVTQGNSFLDQNAQATVAGTGARWDNEHLFLRGASVDVMAGGMLSAQAIFLETGTFTIEGATSNVDLRFSVFVGESVGDGNGFLHVRNGGRLRTNLDSTFLSPSVLGASGTGTATVEGPGSLWESRLQIQVGQDGTGSLTISNGATVTSLQVTSPTGSSGILGRSAGSTGNVTVSGTGSRWTQDGGLNVGFSGHGELSIEAGGAVESLEGFVARFPTGTGAATVTGSGSRWTIGDAMYVGGDRTVAGGIGSLSAASDGTVEIANRMVVWPAGTVDVTGGGQIAIGTGAAAAGTVRVGTGGALFGSGLIMGDIVVDGGMLGPGTSPGQLNVGGNYVQTAAGTLHMEIAGLIPAIEHDVLSVTGMASLDGTLDIDLLGELPPAGSELALIQAAGGITGSFSSVSGINFLADDLAYVLDFESGQVRILVTLPGDANLDGSVDGSDFGIWNAHKFTSGGGLAAGDFNFDGVTDGSDFGVWNAHKFTSVTLNQSVPEPATTPLWGFLLLLGVARRQAGFLN